MKGNLGQPYHSSEETLMNAEEVPNVAMGCCVFFHLGKELVPRICNSGGGDPLPRFLEILMGCLLLEANLRPHLVCKYQVLIGKIIIATAL